MSKAVVFTLQNKGSYNKAQKPSLCEAVVFTLQNKGSYNGTVAEREGMVVVFTLQNKGSYNDGWAKDYGYAVVFTLQNKGSYNVVCGKVLLDRGLLYFFALKKCLAGGRILSLSTIFFILFFIFCVG